jgi:hypothetical protein
MVEDVPRVRALSLRNSFVGKDGFGVVLVVRVDWEFVEVEVLDGEMDA